MRRPHSPSCSRRQGRWCSVGATSHSSIPGQLLRRRIRTHRILFCTSPQSCSRRSEKLGLGSGRKHRRSSRGRTTRQRVLYLSYSCHISSIHTLLHSSRRSHLRKGAYCKCVASRTTQSRDGRTGAKHITRVIGQSRCLVECIATPAFLEFVFSSNLLIRLVGHNSPDHTRFQHTSNPRHRKRQYRTSLSGYLKREFESRGLCLRKVLQNTQGRSIRWEEGFRDSHGRGVCEEFEKPEDEQRP